MRWTPLEEQERALGPLSPCQVRWGSDFGRAAPTGVIFGKDESKTPVALESVHRIPQISLTRDNANKYQPHVCSVWPLRGEKSQNTLIRTKNRCMRFTLRWW